MWKSSHNSVYKLSKLCDTLWVYPYFIDHRYIFSLLQVKSLHQQLEEKDKKIRNLESRLVLSIEESRKSPYRNETSGLSDSFNSSPTRRPDSRASRGSESNSSDFSLSRSASHRKSSSPLHPVRKSDERFNQYHSKSDSASIRHPMRLSVDHGDDRFQMVKSPLPDKSNACSVMWQHTWYQTL